MAPAKSDEALIVRWKDDAEQIGVDMNTVWTQWNHVKALISAIEKSPRASAHHEAFYLNTFVFKAVVDQVQGQARSLPCELSPWSHPTAGRIQPRRMRLDISRTSGALGVPGAHAVELRSPSEGALRGRGQPVRRCSGPWDHAPRFDHGTEDLSPDGDHRGQARRAQRP